MCTVVGDSGRVGGSVGVDSANCVGSSGGVCGGCDNSDSVESIGRS